jgi:hypothetical protein
LDSTRGCGHLVSYTSIETFIGETLMRLQPASTCGSSMESVIIYVSNFLVCMESVQLSATCITWGYVQKNEDRRR